MSEIAVREKLGEIEVTNHRQLSAVDGAIKGACQGIDMRANDIRAIITSCRELCTNAIDHAGGGVLSWYHVTEGDRTGIEVLVEDEGCGIADVEQALVDGYSSDGGLGLGLGGASRMMDAVNIDTKVGEGTRVTAIKWL